MSRCSKCGAPEFTQEKLKELVKRDFKLEKENKLLHDNIDARDKINLKLKAEDGRLRELNKHLNKILNGRDKELINRSGRIKELLDGIGEIRDKLRLAYNQNIVDELVNELTTLLEVKNG